MVTAVGSAPSPLRKAKRMSLERDLVPGATGTEPASPDRRSDGDASVHLEELVIAPLAPLSGSIGGEDASQAIELVGAHLRLSGTVLLGHHRRLSDFMNHHEGLIELRDATVLRRMVIPPESWRPASGSVRPKSP